jgi:hypothetical protein
LIIRRLGATIRFGQAQLTDPHSQTTEEAIVSWVPNPKQLEQVEREEREARLRLSAAREEARGGVPREHHELIHKLEAEWKHALDRLHRVRENPGD